jgi:uncharacterized repeat protein (TIGR03803 family)
MQCDGPGSDRANAATAIALPAQTFTTLHIFDGSDGQLPYAGLIQATDGKLYGTTQSGGANGSGTVFKITPSGALTHCAHKTNERTTGHMRPLSRKPFSLVVTLV